MCPGPAIEPRSPTTVTRVELWTAVQHRIEASAEFSEAESARLAVRFGPRRSGHRPLKPFAQDDAEYVRRRASAALARLSAVEYDASVLTIDGASFSDFEGFAREFCRLSSG